MFRYFSRPLPLMAALGFCTFIPVLSAMVQVVQVPTGTYPEDSAHLAVAPLAWFFHAIAGTAFGLSGPLQFALALKRRFGLLHRVSGRVFVLSGATLGLSALWLLAQVESQRTPLIDVARGLFGLALLLALFLSMAAVGDRDIPRHRAWAIRAYGIGMGSGSVALVFFPIYLITGEAPNGIAFDLVFVAWWALSIGLADYVARRLSPSFRRVAG